MKWADRMAELWDRRRALCWVAAAALTAIWAGGPWWLPEGFGGESLQPISQIPIIGPVRWNSRLRFIAREKALYLGDIPDNADAGELETSAQDCRTAFRDGRATLKCLGGPESVDAGNSPILTLAYPTTLPLPRNLQLAVGSEGGSVIIFQLPATKGETPRPTATLKIDGPVTALAYSDDESKLAVGSTRGGISIWELSGTPRLLKSFQGQEQTVYSLWFTSNLELVYSALDTVVRQRDWQRDSRSTAAEGFTDWPFSSGDYEMWAGDRRSFGSPEPPSDNPSTQVSLSPDRRLIAMVSGTRPSRYWSIWEHGRLSFPFGLRYRAPVPEDFGEGEILWSSDSSALCFASSKPGGCRWLDVATGTTAIAPVRSAVRSILGQGRIPAEGRIKCNRTAFDRMLGRQVIAQRASTKTPRVLIAYAGARFPLVPIGLFGLPVIAGAFMLRVRRSAYWNRKRSLAPATATAETFFRAAGAETSERGVGLLHVSPADPPLSPFAPLPALIVIRPVDQSHIDLLIKEMKSLHGNQPAAGFLLYLDPPDSVVLLRMLLEAHLQQSAVIPMPVAAIERAKDSPTEARALLREYSERFSPGRNLFDDRNAIGDAVAFFGRTRLLARLKQELLSFQSIGLWGLRKTGKTSILLQLEQVFRDRAAVRIGLEPFSTKAPFGNRIFNETLRQLASLLRRCGKETFCPEFPIHLPARDSVAGFLDAAQELTAKLVDAGIPLPVVCMLDEMERVLPADADSAEEFNVAFGALRNLCQDKRLMSLLVTDLFADSSQINQWPIEGAGTNPLFNFLKSVYAGPFAEADTVQMLDSLGKLMNFPLDSTRISSIHEISGGHPFLARQVAAMLYDRREDPSGPARLLANPIRYSETLRSYFPENVWSPLERRGDTAALTIIAMLAEANQWVSDAELQSRCLLPNTVFWSAAEWLAQTGVITRRHNEGTGESYRIAIGMLVQWYQQSEVSVRKDV